jgi:hypothetical protein
MRRRQQQRLCAVIVCAAFVTPGLLTGQDERQGPVRIEGRTFADDLGPWNPLGTTLFWALWAEKHDPERLDRNLAHLAEHEVDYVRILGMVGAPSWEDRTIDPRWPDYWDVAGRLFDRLESHGLRAHVTLFADAQVMMKSSAERRVFADAWARFANSRRPRVFALEVANEGWQNGFEGETGTAELRALGRRLAGLTEIPVALSSVPHEPGAWCAAYAGAEVDVATVHYDRDVSRADGPWRPVQQPWGYPDEFDALCAGQLPPAVINNEPIGPFSSVADDADPVRIALAYAMSFVAGNGAYVYHHGAGIRGGGAADLARGRPANLYDGDTVVLDALAAVKRLLPPGLASWTRSAADAASLPFEGLARAVDQGAVRGAYAAASGDRLVLVVLGIERPATVTAREPMALTVYDPRAGTAQETLRLDKGAPWVIGKGSAGLLVIGKRSGSAGGTAVRD